MKANATQPNVIRTHALAELTSHGILFDTSGATATTVSGLGGIGAQNTSFSHCAPLFLEAGCSIKYLATAQLQAAIKLAKKRPHLHPIIKRPITAKLSAQKNEIQSLREPDISRPNAAHACNLKFRDRESRTKSSEIFVVN